MRSLVIEDTRVGRAAAEAILRPFGPVRVAETLEQARDFLASGYDPDVIVTDLNLRDGGTWQDTMNAVVAMAKGRPIAAYTWQVWDGLPAEFAALYSGNRAVVLSKQNDNALRSWAQRQAGSQAVAEAASFDFDAALSAWAERHGAPKPGHVWAGELVRCLISWQARWASTKDTAWGIFIRITVTLFIGSVFAWLAWGFGWRVPIG
jgi:hypothetical protein